MLAITGKIKLKIYVGRRVLHRKIHGCSCRCSGNFRGKRAEGRIRAWPASDRASIAPVRANQFPPSPIADRCKKSRKRFERKIIAKATDTGRGVHSSLTPFQFFFSNVLRLYLRRRINRPVSFPCHCSNPSIRVRRRRSI